MGVVGDMLRDLDIASFINDLEYGGWFEYVFPFMLVYAIVFTILNYVHIFDDKKPVKVIIAFVVALFAIAFPITDDNLTLGELMEVLFPGVTAFTIGILALYIVVAMLGIDLNKFFGDDEGNNNILKYILGGIGLIVVAYYYAKAFGWNGWDGSWLEDLLTDPLLYILIIFGLFFFWINSDEGEGNSKKREKKIKEGKQALNEI